MIDIQERALGPFKKNVLTAVHCLANSFADIGYKGRQLERLLVDSR